MDYDVLKHLFKLENNSYSKDSYPYNLLKNYIVNTKYSIFLKKQIHNKLSESINEHINEIQDNIDYINNLSLEIIPAIEIEQAFLEERQKLPILKDQIRLLRRKEYILQLEKEIFDRVVMRFDSKVVNTKCFYNKLMKDCKSRLQNVTLDGIKLWDENGINIEKIKEFVNAINPNLETISLLAQCNQEFERAVYYDYPINIILAKKKDILNSYFEKYLLEKINNYKNEIYYYLQNTKKRKRKVLINFLIKSDAIKVSNDQITIEEIDSNVISKINNKKVPQDLFILFNMLYRLSKINSSNKDKVNITEDLKKTIYKIPEEKIIYIENQIKSIIDEKFEQTRSINKNMSDIERKFTLCLQELKIENENKKSKLKDKEMSLKMHLTKNLRAIFEAPKNEGIQMLLSKIDGVMNLIDALYIVYILDCVKNNNYHEESLMIYMEQVVNEKFKYDVNEEVNRTMNCLTFKEKHKKVLKKGEK